MGTSTPSASLSTTLDIEDSFGNCCADRLAISAAKGADMPHEAAVPVLQMIAYVQLIQQRLVAILQELVAAFPRKGVATGDPPCSERVAGCSPPLSV